MVFSLVLCVPAAVSQQAPATPRSNSDVESAARARPLTIPVPKPRTATSDPPQEALNSLEVTFDGTQLMIQAKDCALSEILDAVRARTGANIDVSGGTGEHMTVKIGPGPARQVLSSLLGWTDFDYVIQGSETDAMSIQSIMLFPKTKASTAATMPGTPPLGANRQPLAAHPRAVVDPTPAPVETPEPEAAAPAAQQPSPDATPAIPTQYERRPSATTPDPTAGQTKSSSEMIQDMQQLFEQRKQIQAEHNQTPGAPPLPSH